MPIELSVLDKISADVSTTKLRKYLLAESLIIVTDVGKLGKTSQSKSSSLF